MLGFTCCPADLVLSVSCAAESRFDRLGVHSAVQRCVQMVSLGLALLNRLRFLRFTRINFSD